MLNSIPVFFAVLCSASSSSVRMSGGERLGAADHVEADVVAQQRRELEAEVALEQHHQRADFSGRALPVLDRERVERQHLEAEPRRGFDDVADRVDAGAMPFDARQVPLAGPAAVAVHDDGDVPRQPIEFDLARQRLFGPAGGNPLQQLIEAHGVGLRIVTTKRPARGIPRTGPILNSKV